MLQRFVDYIQGKPSFKRNRMWRYVRKEHLKRNPACAMCGGTKKLQVHHISPVHISPNLELEYSNLITLCRAKKFGIDCHLFIGHRGDFKKFVQYPDELILYLHNRGFKR